MTTQIIETVDSLYEGVAKSHICDKCRRSRPRRGGWRGPRIRVRIFQLVSGGKFHMTRPGRQSETFCGREIE
jgi:hypothetical protein